MKLFKHTALVLALLSSFSSYSQWADCSNSIGACTNPSFSINSTSGFGLIEEYTTTSNISNPLTNPNVSPGNSGCMLSGELNSTWLLITVTTSGTLEFSLGDNTSTNYYDWIMWSYDANTCSGILNNTLPPVACNYNASANSFTGMANPANLPAGAVSGNFENPLNANPGDQFILSFSNYSGATTTVPLDFFGSATVSCGGAFGTTVCEGDTATIYALDGVNYTWDTSVFGFIGTNITGDTAYVNPTITTSYSVIITLSDGSIVNDTAIVLVLPSINATSTITEDVCFGDQTATILVNTPGGTAPFSFNLTGPISNTNTNGTFLNLPDGNYTINITDDFGCSDQIGIIINPGPLCCDIVISTKGDTVNCSQDCSGIVVVDTATAHPPVSFQWFDEFNNPIFGETNDTLFSQCEGIYYVEVTDAVCMKRDTNSISINLTLPIVVSSNDTTINADQEVTLWSSGGASYGWFPPTYLDCFSCDTVISTPGDDVTYFIVVTDSLGCQVEDTINVIVQYNPLFIPNGFSPNNDNNNDIFYVRGGGVASFQIQIFDKWGNLVFETTDNAIGWDGTYKGKPVNTGVYVYRLDATLKNREILFETGNVTLFR